MEEKKKIPGKLASEEKPKLNGVGISRRVLVQTNRGRMGMGYWDELYMRWETEFLLGAQEYVMLWADAEIVHD